MKHKVWIGALGIFLAFCATALILKYTAKNHTETDQGGGTVSENGSSQTYTWEEYLGLSVEEQNAFAQEFDSEKAFEDWMNAAKPAEEAEAKQDWNKLDKNPNEYNWDEYLDLSLEEQDAFFQEFGSEDAFEDWMNAVKPAEDIEPDLEWNKPGKKPDAYTWEEYLQLSSEERDAFFLWFDSEDAFKRWMENVEPEENVEIVVKWDKSGKTPDEYTWEEYEALTSGEQDAFFSWFESTSAFEAWMENAKPAVSDEPAPKWDKPGKTPDAYTWDEYLALDLEEQDEFFCWFESTAAFETWMENVKPEESVEPEPTWDKPGKTPDAYTWEEYLELTAKEQDAFFLWFGSTSAFEAWMEQVKPVETDVSAQKWDKPGKKPDAYTWEEYQLLSPEDQDAFFLWFGTVEAFEAWMDTAMGASE